MENKVENKKVFIGNLSFSATNEDIANLVSTFGIANEVRVSQKKGCAVVEMSQLVEAEELIRRLNKSEFMGRALMVSFQLPPKKAKALSTKRFEERNKKYNDGKSRDAAKRSSDPTRKKPLNRDEFSKSDERKGGTRQFGDSAKPKFLKPFAEKSKEPRERFNDDDSFERKPNKRDDKTSEFKPRKPREDREKFDDSRESKPRAKTSSKFFENTKADASPDQKPRSNSKPRKIEGSKAVAKLKKSKATGAELRLERKAVMGKRVTNK